MTEQLITFETAKLAKEKGFNEFTNTIYNSGKIEYLVNISLENSKNSNLLKSQYSAPTQSLLQKWLREKYDIIVVVDWYLGEWIYMIKATKLKHYHIPVSEKSYSSYEEALEEGLLRALKKENKNERD